MAIYGIGAYWDQDVSDDFIERGMATIGWHQDDAPTLHNILKHIKVGDILYIKSYPPGVGLMIKAVGIVLDDAIYYNEKRDVRSRKVKWVWQGEERLGTIDDKYNVRSNTIYEEFNEEIQKKVLDLLLSMVK